MDAIGIQAVLIDEYLQPDNDAGKLLPGYDLPGGGFRPIGPNAEAAALAHPDRFAFLMRMNPLDPGLEGWVETLAASPQYAGAAHRRLQPGGGGGVGKRWFRPAVRRRQGAQPAGLRHLPGRVPRLAHYARTFPDVRFIIDHCGVAFDAPRGAASIDDTIAMAAYPNVALKWAHAPAFLSTAPYPFPDLEPKLARALAAFGRERIVWASDYTVSRHRQNWAESLFAIRHSPTLSETDKEWILGRTIRTLLNWPAPETPFAHKPMHPHRLGGV